MRKRERKVLKMKGKGFEDEKRRKDRQTERGKQEKEGNCENEKEGDRRVLKMRDIGFENERKSIEKERKRI
jgi:hypothetical protein